MYIFSKCTIFAEINNKNDLRCGCAESYIFLQTSYAWFDQLHSSWVRKRIGYPIVYITIIKLCERSIIYKITSIFHRSIHNNTREVHRITYILAYKKTTTCKFNAPGSHLNAHSKITNAKLIYTTRNTYNSIIIVRMFFLNFHSPLSAKWSAWKIVVKIKLYRLSVSSKKKI